MSKPFGIAIGAFSSPISKQLRASGIRRDALDHFDKDADAINRLRIRGLMSDAECDRACKRLVLSIRDAMPQEGRP